MTRLSDWFLFRLFLCFFLRFLLERLLGGRSFLSSARKRLAGGGRSVLLVENVLEFHFALIAVPTTSDGRKLVRSFGFRFAALVKGFSAAERVQ